MDKGKSEEELLKIMASVEKLQTEVKELTASVEVETSKLGAMRTEIGERVKELQAEIDALRPLREAAAAAVTPQARQAFERLADRFEGEAMSA